MKTFKENEKEFTSYKEATKNLDLVLCNDITKYHKLTDHVYRLSDYIDEASIKRIHRNKQFTTDEERQEAIRRKAIAKIEEDTIFQYYLTDANLTDVEYYVKKYGLIFALCKDLNVWVLLVDHVGTRWDLVKVEVK